MSKEGSFSRSLRAMMSSDEYRGSEIMKILSPGLAYADKMVANSTPVRSMRVGGPMATGSEQACDYCHYASDLQQGRNRRQHHANCPWVLTRRAVGLFAPTHSDEYSPSVAERLARIKALKSELAQLELAKLEGEL